MSGAAEEQRDQTVGDVDDHSQIVETAKEVEALAGTLGLESEVAVDWNQIEAPRQQRDHIHNQSIDKSDNQQSR